MSKEILALIIAVLVLAGSAGASTVYNHWFDKKKLKVQEGLGELDIMERRLKSLRELNAELLEECDKLKTQVTVLNAENLRLSAALARNVANLD